MAAPFVSATAALVRVANPTLTKAQVDTTLLATARDDADGDGRDNWFGHGILQADQAALSAAHAPGGLQAQAPAASTKVKATSGKSKLRVDVNPNKGEGYWTFQVQKQRADGSWKPAEDVQDPGQQGDPHHQPAQGHLPGRRQRQVRLPGHHLSAGVPQEVAGTRRLRSTRAGGAAFVYWR